MCLEADELTFATYQTPIYLRTRHLPLLMKHIQTGTNLYVFLDSIARTAQ